MKKDTKENAKSPRHNFKKYIENFSKNLEALKACPAITSADKSSLPAAAGVYLFSEGKRDLYVGRTRNIRRRIGGQVSGGIAATFTFILAREKSRKTIATYKKGKGSRKALMQDAKFIKCFDAARERVKKMDIRHVEESCATRQALLEIYIAVELDTEYNSFRTT